MYDIYSVQYNIFPEQKLWNEIENVINNNYTPTQKIKVVKPEMCV